MRTMSSDSDLTNATFIVRCALCGRQRRIVVDPDSDDDIAQLGIILVEMAEDGHVVIAMGAQGSFHRGDVN